MEGVVVTAHKDGSIVSVSVTTDKSGHYAFPENRLEPGHYTLAIRAAGYDLGAPPQPRSSPKIRWSPISSSCRPKTWPISSPMPNG